MPTKDEDGNATGPANPEEASTGTGSEAATEGKTPSGGEKLNRQQLEALRRKLKARFH